MRKLLTAGIAIAAILAATVAGYRLGAGKWPDPHTWTAASVPEAVAMPAAAPKKRTVLYWKHPDNDADFAAEPKKTGDGRDYLPVYDDQEADFAEAKPKEPLRSATGAPKKLLYYRNPMGLPDTSPVPKKDWMGMDYIPVYEGEEDEPGTVKVSVAKLQNAGVRSETAAMRRLVRPIRAPGVAKPDERTLLTVALRADSFIEKLYVNETGRHVKKGEPLFRIYSPDMVKVQVDYRISTNAGGNRDDRGALQRLENLLIPEAVMSELRRTRQPVISFDWPSPVSGVVMQKKAIEGMMMKAGDEMLRLADLTSIWIIADVPEQDIAQVRVGATAKVSFRAFPNEVFNGRVTFILHELEMVTRTAKVRIEVANPDHRIKHEMFADVAINAGDGEAERLSVPVSALIDSGNRQVVIVDRGKGRFEPRAVKVGVRGDGFIEIAEGIKAGENVVVAANFLIDAESNLKAALSTFTADQPPVSAPAPAEKQP
ncbi:MAG: efflux RND transporter periplasmic adaptor subunit [Hyphomicrobiaceae bacterium]|nr:efflux RND transporter periplasmic adaptor subunit [Hyphomicrobiaceae bacterium]